jgi:hypothetical protein
MSRGRQLERPRGRAIWVDNVEDYVIISQQNQTRAVVSMVFLTRSKGPDSIGMDRNRVDRMDGSSPDCIFWVLELDQNSCGNIWRKERCSFLCSQQDLSSD